MIAIKRILCPVDFSDHSRRAAAHAVAIAGWYEATVTALHVVSAVPVAAFGPDAAVFPPMVLTAPDRDQLLAETRAFVASNNRPEVTVDALIREGAAAAEIVDQANSMNADLLVIGTHGRSGVERLVLGSVTEKVVRKVGCPVLTVPRQADTAVATGPVLFKRILCAVDFSDSSTRAVQYALSLAQEAEGSVTIVHVLEEASIGQVGIGEEHVALAALQRRHEERARQCLEEMVPEGAAPFCTIDRLLLRGRAWREILRFAVAWEADLIVLGVQDRGPSISCSTARQRSTSCARHTARSSRCARGWRRTKPCIVGKTNRGVHM